MKTKTEFNPKHQTEKSEEWKKLQSQIQQEKKNRRPSQEEKDSFESFFGNKILNWDEIKVQSHSNPGWPRMRETIRIMCKCGKISEKLVTADLMKSSSRAICKSCSNKAVIENRSPAEKASVATIAKRKETFDGNRKGLGTSENEKMKNEFEKKLGSKILNWDSLVFTCYGSPSTKVGEDSQRQELEFICQSCGKQSSFTFASMGTIPNYCASCAACHAMEKRPKRSKGEIEIEEFLVSIGEKVISTAFGVSPGFEVDIYLPEKNLGIEYNGLYWHNESRKGKKYHLEKLQSAEKNGKRLIQIFEDEWQSNKESVKNRLLQILGKNKTLFGARECSIESDRGGHAKELLEKHHLQKSCSFQISKVAYFNDLPVAAMTFSKPRTFVGGSDSDWELVRFVSSGNIPGIASRLLKSFQKDHPGESIFSYADRRWSDGGLYEALGFKKTSESEPNYWYILNGRRFHRFNFAKHKLVEEGFDPNMTESEIMEERGYSKIWDCGSLVYRLDPLNIPC